MFSVSIAMYSSHYGKTPAGTVLASHLAYVIWKVGSTPAVRVAKPGLREGTTYYNYLLSAVVMGYRVISTIRYHFTDF